MTELKRCRTGRENFSSSASGREGGELDEELVLKQCVKTQWGALLNPIEDAWYLENQFITFSSLSPFSSEGFITRLENLYWRIELYEMHMTQY